MQRSCSKERALSISEQDLQCQCSWSPQWSKSHFKQVNSVVGERRSTRMNRERKSIVTNHGLWLSHFFFKLFLFPFFWVLFLSICKGLFWISKASEFVWYQWSLSSHCCNEIESMIMYQWFKHERMCIRDSILVVIIMLCYWIARNESLDGSNL